MCFLAIVLYLLSTICRLIELPYPSNTYENALKRIFTILTSYFQMHVYYAKNTRVKLIGK